MGSFGFKRRHGLSFYGMGHASNTGNKRNNGRRKKKSRQ